MTCPSVHIAYDNRDVLKPAVVAGGIDGNRPAAATLMLRAGIDLMVQQILDHALASTTLNIYGHVMRGTKAEGMAALASMLRRAADDSSL